MRHFCRVAPPSTWHIQPQRGLTFQGSLYAIMQTRLLWSR
jgi:hypothetical protein